MHDMLHLLSRVARTQSITIAMLEANVLIFERRKEKDDPLKDLPIFIMTLRAFVENFRETRDDVRKVVEGYTEHEENKITRFLSEIAHPDWRAPASIKEKRVGIATEWQASVGPLVKDGRERVEILTSHLIEVETFLRRALVLQGFTI